MSKEYIVHKAVEPSKVVKARQRPIHELAMQYEGQAKYDGCCALVFLPPEGGAYTKSRTGEDVQSMGRAEAECQKIFPKGLVVIGEAWCDYLDFNQISGEFRRYAESEHLTLVVNDVLTWEEFEQGYSHVPYCARRQRIPNELRQAQDAAFGYVTQAAWWPPGTYDPQEVCNVLVAGSDLYPGKFDGFVMKDPMGLWRKNDKGTQGEVLKIKRKLSFDLRVLRREEGVGEKTGRAVYTIVVSFKGKELRVGSGIPHKLSEVPLPGQIVEVEAMDYSSDGLLREPRYKGIRHDKLEADY